MMGQSRSRSRRLALTTALGVLVVSAGLVTATSATAAPDDRQSTSERQSPRDQLGRSTAQPRGLSKPKGRQAFLLRLSARSTADAYAGSLPAGKPAARTAARSQLGRVREAQRQVAADLPPAARVLYRSHAALNAIAVSADARSYPALQRISGVTAVYPIADKSRSNSYAVPLVGAPGVWQDLGNTGEGTSIAIIDTGLDYTHANFGGPGTLAAYQAAHAAETAPANPAYFPSDKIVGGYDFAGDAYDAGSADPALNTPNDDPNPLDCQGHGSHVGGSAAGLGVEEDGDTYSGPYDASTPFDDLKIGPGVAPGADLYAFRVFGCDGSTNVTGAALDRAMDPNGDGDTSDHVDVVNLSLGSDFGSAMDGDAVLANELAASGIQVVVASGNGGDVFDVGGSPGNAPRTLTVANSADEYSQLDALHVTAPAGVAGDYGAQRSVAYAWAEDPDLAGNVVRLSDATNLEGCDPLSPADADAVEGKIAWMEWTDTNGQIECGSVARSGNAAAAGAIGFVFATNEAVFSAGITGSTEIPGVMIDKAAGDALRASATAGTLVVDGTTPNGFRSMIAGLDDTLNGGSSRNSRNEGGVKPDVTAVGTTVFSTGVGTGSDGANMSGTSMATPMVAGLAALVISDRPGWTTEEVKADIMNTAGHDLWTEPGQGGTPYAPNRVGSGRIDAVAALANDVIAYVGEDDGAVSVSFGPIEATDDISRTKTVLVENKGSSAATYTVSYDALTEIPGVDYQVSPASVTVAAGQTKALTVTLSIDSDQLTKPIDPTMDRLQAGLPRQYLADASGRVILDSGDSRPDLRVPVYAAPRPASQMTQASEVSLTPGPSPQTGSIDLTGTGVDQGAGQDAVSSLVSGYELQATSGPAKVCSAVITTGCVHNADERASDVKYVGTTSRAYGPSAVDDGVAYFAIATHGPWYTAASQTEFDIYLDTTGDDVSDFVIFNTRLPDTDVLVAQTVHLETGAVADIQFLNDYPGTVDTALFDADALVLPVGLAWLGDYDPDTGDQLNQHLSAENPRISYGIASFSNQANAPVDELGFGAADVDGSLSVDVIEPALVVGVDNDSLNADQAGQSLDVTRNWDSYDADSGLGALVIHHHNEVGDKAQVVEIEDTRVETTVTLGLDPTGVTAGEPVTATVTVDETGVETPTGAVELRTADDDVLATGTLDADGEATIEFEPVEGGAHQVRALYSGDATYFPAESAPVSLAVAKAASTTTLALSSTSVQAGKSLTGTVTVTGGADIPSGVVTLKAGSRTLGSGSLDGTGTSTITYKAVPAGTYSVVARYAGDSTYNASQSAARTLTVAKIKPKVKLRLPESVKKGTTFTAVVRVPAVNGLVPSGKVSIRHGAEVLKSGRLRNGKARLRIEIDRRGTVRLYAKYAGNANYTSAKSKTVRRLVF